MTETQYLQVPKVLPHRKSRSRSKTRPREVVSVEEVRISSTKDRPRLGSPPMPGAELSVKPSMTTYTNGYKWTDMDTTEPPLSSPQSRPASHTPPSPLQQLEPARVQVTYAAPVIQEQQAQHQYHQPQPPPPQQCPQPSVNYDDLNGEMYTLGDSLTPPPELPLRHRIIGAWKLESYIAYPTTESHIQRPTYPMTKNVTGFIMYTPDGYMSAQMLIPGQQSFKRGEGEEPQWAEAGKRCFAYCGPYYINNEGLGREETLRHTFQVCNLPGWIGDVQIRTHRFEEDGQVLVLGSQDPTEIKVCNSNLLRSSCTPSSDQTKQGDKRIPVLKWRRARDNSEGEPPPPTPQIKISGPGEP